MSSQASDPAVGLQRHSVAALNPLQRASDRVRLATRYFECGARLEITAGFVGTAKPRVSQSAKIIGPRIAAAAVDRIRQVLVCGAVIPTEERMNTAPIQFFQQGILSPHFGAAKRQCRQGNTPQPKIPRHEKRSLNA